MATWYDENEVLVTTDRALCAMQAKYQSSSPSSFTFAPFVTPASPKAAEPSFSSDVNYARNLPQLASFTSIPHVAIDHPALVKEIEDNLEHYTTKALPPDWAQTYHYTAKDFSNESQCETLIQYVLVLDALNFCFWPLQGYEYEHLAGSLKAALEADPNAFSAESLASITEERLSKYLQPPSHFPLISNPGLPAAVPMSNGMLPIPLLPARTRLLREVGAVLLKHFHGKAANLIRMANGSAMELVRLVTSYFPGFRDHAQYGGDQVFFYKRAQIFVGDVWGAFQGQGLGTFRDMHKLTCFADYRIPQLLRGMGILKFSAELEKKVEALEEIPAGSEEEMAIRCITVQCVEAIRVELEKRQVITHPFQLDWLLWEAGEKLMKEGKIVPHHRTITTYY